MQETKVKLLDNETSLPSLGSIRLSLEDCTVSLTPARDNHYTARFRVGGVHRGAVTLEILLKHSEAVTLRKSLLGTTDLTSLVREEITRHLKD